jgi:hypothetical protein
MVLKSNQIFLSPGSSAAVIETNAFRAERTIMQSKRVAILLFVACSVTKATHQAREVKRAQVDVGNPCTDFWDYVCNRQTQVDVSDRRSYLAAAKKRAQETAQKINQELLKDESYRKDLKNLKTNNPLLGDMIDESLSNYRKLEDKGGDKAIVHLLEHTVKNLNATDVPGSDRRLYAIAKDSKKSTMLEAVRQKLLGPQFGRSNQLSIPYGADNQGYYADTQRILRTFLSDLYGSLLIKHSSSNADLKRKLLDLSYPPSMRKEHGELWKSVQTSAERFLAENNLPLMPEKTRGTKLKQPEDLAEALELLNSGDEPKYSIKNFSVELNRYTSVRDPNPVFAILAHEYGHAIARNVNSTPTPSCRLARNYSKNWALGEPYSILGNTSSYGKFFDRVVTCLKEATGAEVHQLEEAFADWISAELLARKIEQSGTNERDLQAAAFGAVYTCEDRAYLPGDTHLSERHRANRIFMAHPYFRGLFHCPATTDPKYCGAW